MGGTRRSVIFVSECLELVTGASGFLARDLPRN